MEDFSFDKDTCPKKSGRFGYLRKRDLLFLLLVLLWLGLKGLWKWSCASVGSVFRNSELRLPGDYGWEEEMITCPRCCAMTAFYTDTYIESYNGRQSAAECQCANCGLIFGIPIDRPLARVIQSQSGHNYTPYGWSPYSSSSTQTNRPINIDIGPARIDNRKRVTGRLSDLGEKKVSVTEIRGMVIEETNLELKKETDNEAV